MEAIVLAGGLGRRLSSVVSDVPKPLAPIEGKPFLSYLLDYWIDQGIDRFILSVGYRWRMIARRLGPKYRQADIFYAIEDTPLGTGGGVVNAMSYLKSKGTFLVLNGDTQIKVPLKRFLSFHREKSAQLSLSVRPVDSPDRYHCLELTEENRVVNFYQTAVAAPRSFVNAGSYLFEPDVFTGLGRLGKHFSLENQLIPKLIKDSVSIFGFSEVENFIDIGVPEAYQKAQQTVPLYLNKRVKQ